MSRSSEKPRVAITGEVVRNPASVFLSRPALALGTLFAIALLFELAPLKRLRVLSPRGVEEAAELRPTPADSVTQAVGEAELTSETRNRPELAQPERVTGPKDARGPIAQKDQAEAPLPSVNAKEPPVPIVDPSGKALDGFFRALVKTLRKEPRAITRVTHFGDSIVASDYVTGTLRRKLHGQFGDAGHGFMLIANAWPAYFHNDVFRYASPGWRVSRVVGPYAADGLYGLGGVSFQAPAGARARFGTAKTGEFGRRVSRFVLFYLKQPGGGEIEILLDGKSDAVLSTAGPEKSSALHEVRAPDGEHELEIVTKSGQSRAFGVALERDEPGVILDAIGIQGARIRFLDKQDDAHWAEQLALRRPDLLIYEFGANESADGFLYPMVDYHRTMKEVLLQGKRALPEAGCLVVGAMDRAAKKDEKIVSVLVTPHLVEAQKKAAFDAGCGFFDTYQAMGGRGSMPTWVRRGLGQADLTHPTGVGSEVLGNWIYRALMAGFDASLRRGRPD